MMAMIAQMVRLLIFLFSFLVKKPTKKPSMALIVKVPGAYCAATRASDMDAPAPATAPTKGPSSNAAT